MNNLNEELEFLDIDDEDLESIARYNRSLTLGFPAVCVGSSNLYFNYPAGKIMDGWKYAKYYFNTEYVVIEKAALNDTNKFKLRVMHYKPTVGSHGVAGAVPSNLKEKKIQLGVYKLYKCKRGLAFKRYEPLEARDGFTRTV